MADGLRIAAYVWNGVGIFYGIFLYYLFVFCVGVAAAYWYYRMPEKSVFSGCSKARFNVGSFTFASTVITIVTIIRNLVQQQADDADGIFALLLCLVQCVLSCFEALLEVLNHNAVIVMSVTGEGYIDAAKSTVSLIFSNFGVYYIVNFFSNFVNFYGTVMCVVGPSLLGAYLTWRAEDKLDNNDRERSAIIIGVFIFILALIFSQIIIGVLTEALSCMFIFYSFDSRFRKEGIPVNNMPPKIRALFDGHDGSETEMREIQRAPTN